MKIVNKEESNYVKKSLLNLFMLLGTIGYYVAAIYTFVFLYRLIHLSPSIEMYFTIGHIILSVALSTTRTIFISRRVGHICTGNYVFILAAPFTYVGFYCIIFGLAPFILYYVIHEEENIFWGWLSESALGEDELCGE